MSFSCEFAHWEELEARQMKTLIKGLHSERYNAAKEEKHEREQSRGIIF